jgi:hypothetical protein
MIAVAKTKPLNVCRQCGWMWAGRKAKFCSKECQSAAYYKSQRSQRYQHECKHCGKAFRSSRKEVRHCSPACNVATRVVNAKRAPRTCHQCGNEFIPKATYRTTYCSRECSHASMRTQPEYNGPTVTVTGQCIKCGGWWVRSEPWNPMFWKTPGRTVCGTCTTQAATAIYQLRRARKKNNGPHEHIVPLRVYKRDGHQCQLCGWTFKDGEVHPHPRSPSIDHIIPLSRGGHHTYNNVQAACLACNASKGASTEHSATHPIGVRGALDH